MPIRAVRTCQLGQLERAAAAAVMYRFDHGWHDVGGEEGVA